MKDKISIDLDIEELLGLKENKNTLEYDLRFILDNGIDEYVKQLQEHEKKKQEFISLFKECYDDLCLYMEKDPKHRVAISCYTCLKGMDLSKQYGKPIN